MCLFKSPEKHYRLFIRHGKRCVRGRLQDQGPLPGQQVLLRHYQGQVRKLFPNFRENKLASHGLVSGAMFVNLANLFKTKIPTDNFD